MPHHARKLGESGFYHVVTKGNGSQVIFEETKDRIRYLRTLEDAVDANDVRIHAYCLMENHIHLLVQSECACLSPFMKQLNETYAMYFMKATERVGHVFQRPFWSEPISNDAYFLSALRYIHANPEPAGICKAADYPWSSYWAHMGEPSFVEVDFTRNLLGGKEQFERFSMSGGKYAIPFPHSKLHRHLAVDELAQIALALIGRATLNELRAMSPKLRKPHIAKMREAGFTENEIIRVTGLGRASVRHALS